MAAAHQPRASWRAALLNRRMLICVFTGFSSGLPLYTLVSLVPAWLRSEQIDLKAIGLFSLIQLPYTWKFLWSPFADRYALTPLGRRRSWMLAAQVALLVSIALLGALDPSRSLWSVAAFALAIAVFSATQDIALDAYRREILSEVEFGLGNAVHVNAYRIAGLVPGSLALILADHLPWSSVYAVTALFMLPGIALTLAVQEPVQTLIVPRTLRASIVEPFREFVGRAGWKTAAVTLAFVFFYKLGDSMATALATPFYLDMGFSKSEIGLIAKNAGLWPSVAASLVAGVWMMRLGINRALWLFGAVQLLSIFGFALLSQMPGDRVALAAVIGFEAVGVGLGTTALIAFIARATHPGYAATQFALFTSLAAVPRVLVNSGAGWIVDALGWFDFFLLCALLGIPGMLLLARVAPWREERAAGKPDAA